MEDAGGYRADFDGDLEIGQVSNKNKLSSTQSWLVINNTGTFVVLFRSLEQGSLVKFSAVKVTFHLTTGAAVAKMLREDGFSIIPFIAALWRSSLPSIVVISGAANISPGPWQLRFPTPASP
jgi:hypothetical protein